MESVLTNFWLVAVLILGIVRLVKRAADKGGKQEQDVQQADPEQPGQSAEETNFVYFYTFEGRKKVDVNKSNAASGRELSEYEIFSEQQRLDKLWCQELERQEAEELSGQAYEYTQPEKAPDMQEIMACARSGAAEHVDAHPSPAGSSSDREYQLQQLERWLEAGLIDKAEYKKRKREL